MHAKKELYPDIDKVYKTDNWGTSISNWDKGKWEIKIELKRKENLEQKIIW